MRIARTALAALTAATCLVALWGNARPALAKDPLTVTKTTIGFGGKYKAGFWNPVWLTVQAGPRGADGTLELVIPDGDQVPVVYADEQRGRLALAPNQEKSLLLYAKTGPLSATISVQLRGEQGVVWSQDLVLGPASLPTQELVVGIGPSVGLDAAQASIKRTTDVALVTAQVESPASLPDRWWGYEGVDAVVLATSDRQFIDQITTAQRQALIQWVQLGGRLVLCVGANGEQLLAADSPWAELAPGKLADVSPLRDGSGLETFTASKLPHNDDLFQSNRPQATRLTDATGIVLVEEGGAIAANRPLIVHAPHGLGQVLFVGIDLDHPALDSWKGRPNLIARLLQGQDPREQSDRESRRSVTHLGYEDLVGQLRAALDQFPGVKLVNFTTVSLLTIVYLLLVGPGDYLLLSRLGWPRQWTWISFPLVAIALGGLAWLFGGQSHGHRVRVNQAEVIDLDATLGIARGTVWAHVYSPATDHYDPQLQFDLPQNWGSDSGSEPSGWLTWQGLPGESLGGLGSRQVALSAAEPYHASLPGQQAQLNGLPVPVASSKSLAGRWWSSAKVDADPKLTENQFGVLTGEFRYALQVELSDCLLIHGEKLYRLNKLQPGQTVHMDDFTPLNLEARLTQRTVVLSKDVSTPWDKASIDVPRIVLMMMFHDAARGSSYTGLTNRYQPYVDLTEQVRLGRAVLTGRAQKSVCELRQGDEPLADSADLQTWTWYRIVLPVGQGQPTNP